MMRQPPRPPASSRRLSRLISYMKLFLMWFVSVYAPLWVLGARFHVRHLDRVASGVAGITLSMVYARLPVHKWRPPRHGQFRLNHVTRRAITGSRLRRALSGRDWPSRLHAILAVARDLEAHVATLGRRLWRGLSRLRRIDPKPAIAPALPAAPLCARVCADTS